MTSVSYTADGWGVGQLWVSERRVVHHDLPHPRPHWDALLAPVDSSPNRPQGTAGLPGETVSRKSGRDRDVFASKVVDLLLRHFEGEAVDLGAVPLELDGLTGFQRALHDTLRDVRRGEIVTYGELAALAGRPGAARAAGTFCARNRFALFVPCHRVVAASGIGGYGSLGLAYKRRLLALEDVAV